jgi:hypothetical protein
LAVAIRYLVLDVMKPHEPPLLDFASKICTLKNIKKVDVSLIEFDERTESLKVIIEGSAIDFESLKEHINDLGGAIHSVDQVIVEKD